MPILFNKALQYVKYLITPENSEVSLAKVPPGYPVIHAAPELAGSVKAIFWCMVAILLPLVISGIH